MVSHNFYSGTTPDISTQVRTNCFSGLAGYSARDSDTHLEAADARVPAHVVGAESARAAGARHQPLLEVGPRADHGPGGLGLGPHGVVCGVTGYGHNIRVSVSPHSRRISEKLTPCAALQAEMSLAGRTVLCTGVLVYCAARHLYSTVLHCTVYSALSPAPPGRLSGAGLRNSHGPRRYLLSCHCHWLKASNFLSVYKYVVSFRIFFQETISFSSKSSAPQVSSANYSFLVLWSNPPAS